jgi:hypothetical protein
MTKQEVITQVQSSLGSMFTREDVIKCLNMVVEEKPKVETKASYPSKEWLEKIKQEVLSTIKEVDFNDTDMYDGSNFEFSIKHGNEIELDSFDIDACALKVYVENEIENAFGVIEDDIIAILPYNEEEERLNSNEALKEAMEN